MLVVYGTNDLFTGVEKYRRWRETWEVTGTGGEGAEEGGTEDEGREVCEVEGAGHFWVEEGVGRMLGDAVRVWVRKGGDIYESKRGTGAL